MKFAEHLSKKMIREVNQLKHELREKEVEGLNPHIVVFDEMYEKPNKSIKEKISRRELEELMGIRRDTYERRRGAVRRR